MGFVSNPPAVPTVAGISSDALVFDAAAPTGFTDLDLSAEIGANEAIVLLKVLRAAGSGRVEFRTNGDTTALARYSICGVNILGVEDAWVIVVTDAAGIIEWKVNAADAVAIRLQSYWKAAS